MPGHTITCGLCPLRNCPVYFFLWPVFSRYLLILSNKSGLGKLRRGWYLRVDSVSPPGLATIFLEMLFVLEMISETEKGSCLCYLVPV